MPRRFDNWLESYVEYAGVTEAPRHMARWAGVAALAGALRRRVWIDMRRFIWTPNFYIVFVAPPGVVSKSTTTDIAMDLLKEVPGIKFGPDIITWPALVSAFAEAAEMFEYNEEWLPMAPLTLVASEMGSLINPQDREMMNLYITLWDGRKTFEKVTKMSGCDTISAPWINMVACTTPHWVADNMPAAAVGGGFTSRCIFVYADTKERYIPFVDEMVTDDDPTTRLHLIEDLTHIAETLVGPYRISQEARDWYRPIYRQFWEEAVTRMDDTTAEGYAARKQTHLFKTALILAAAKRDERVIELEDAEEAAKMLEEVEGMMQQVFSRIGRTEESLAADKFLRYVQRMGRIPYEQAYMSVHKYFPDHRVFEGILSGGIRSGQLSLEAAGNGFWIVPGPAFGGAVRPPPEGREAAGLLDQVMR